MITAAVLGLASTFIDKFIEDKDKKAEIAESMMVKMLDTQTYRWVDALVKLSYAGEQIIKGLVRPLGSFAMACFGAYCAYKKGIQLDPTVQTLLFGSPVAWGVSRFAEKKRQLDED